MPSSSSNLTWAALLAHWVDFARRSLALPPTQAGRTLKACVPDIIMLQAVWFALDDLDSLTPSERALALDKAGVLIEKHSAAILHRHQSLKLPDALTELIDDVQQRYQACRT